MSEQKTYDFIDALHRMKHEGKKMQSVHGGWIYYMKDGYLTHGLSSRCNAEINAYFMNNGRTSQYIDYIEPFDWKKLKPGDKFVFGNMALEYRFVGRSSVRGDCWFAEYVTEARDVYTHRFIGNEYGKIRIID